MTTGVRDYHPMTVKRRNRRRMAQAGAKNKEAEKPLTNPPWFRSLAKFVIKYSQVKTRLTPI